MGSGLLTTEKQRKMEDTEGFWWLGLMELYQNMRGLWQKWGVQGSFGRVE